MGCPQPVGKERDFIPAWVKQFKGPRGGRGEPYSRPRLAIDVTLPAPMIR